MRIDTLSPAEGANTPAKRLGRGIGSGLGKTSGKGHKGQWARSGGGVRPGFEGGRMPIARRIPKRGFNNKWKKEYVVVYVLENGLAKEVKNNCGLKVLAGGELSVKLTVRAAKFSVSAKEAIEKVGGTAEVIE